LFTKFYADRSKSEEMATVFRNSIWRRPPSRISVVAHFGRHRCILSFNHNICTKFDTDWSNSKEIATVFLNSRCRCPPSWIPVVGHVDVIDVILPQIATFPLILTLLLEYVKKWQQFFQNSIWRRSPSLISVFGCIYQFCFKRSIIFQYYITFYTLVGQQVRQLPMHGRGNYERTSELKWDKNTINNLSVS